MVKTTLELKDELYRKLVNEALNKYGNTKNLSKVINENLESHFKESTDSKAKKYEEIKRRLEIVRRSAGSWRSKESGDEYTRNIRKGWEKRLKKMGL